MLKAYLVLLFNCLCLTDNAIAALYRPGPDANGNGNTINLIADIRLANSTADDDIIDLGGLNYVLTDSVVNDVNGCTGLPVISEFIPSSSILSGKLSVLNGTIRRVASGDSVNCLGNFRFFYVEDGAFLDLFNVTLIFGSSDPGEISHINSVSNSGGAVYNLGTLTITNCAFMANFANGNGGAIYNSGTCDIVNSIVSNNNALVSGGGIYNDDAIDMVNSTVSENSAIASGGGIFSDGTMDIVSSTISGNGDELGLNGMGAGVFNDISGVASLYNSTIANNGALVSSSVLGGGIFNGNIINVYNSTISGNGNAATVSGGGIYNQGIIASLVSNIIAANAGVSGANIYNVGSISSLNERNNMLGSMYGTTITNGVNYDIVGCDPKLGPLQDNGGPTFTMALLPSSLAINNGFNPRNLVYDQRGSPYRRTIFARPDIGAYETQKLHDEKIKLFDRKTMLSLF